MKESVQVSLVQFAATHLDPSANAARMVEFAAAEADRGAELVVFPELASVGPVRWPPEADAVDAFRAVAEPVPGPTTTSLAETARSKQIHIVAGVLEAGGEHIFDSAVILGPSGELIGVHRKLHLEPAERSLLTAGDVVRVFPTNVGRLAVSLSYDVSFPELARVQALEGAEILVSLWASQEPEGRSETDGIIMPCRSRATENFVYVLGCNASLQGGGRGSRSVIVSCNGEVISDAGGGEEEVVRGGLTEAAFRDQRMYLTIFRDRRPELYESLVDRK